MNRIVIAIFSALMLLAFPSQAQQIIVVASCPATLSPPLNQGAPGRLTVDVNGILCTNASGGGGGGAITAAANSYATGFSPDIGVFGSMVPYQGSGTANVINLLGGIEEDARGPLATQANSVSIGGVGILAPLGTTNIAGSVAVTASTGALVDLYSATAPTPYAGTGAAANITELEAIRQNSAAGTTATPGATLGSWITTGGTSAAGLEPWWGVAVGGNYLQSTNLGSVGGTAIALGQTTANASIPFVPASDYLNDPCMTKTKTNFAIATSSGNLQVVGGSGSTKVWVCSEFIIGATAWVGNLIEGTGAACTTANEAAVQGSTTAGSGVSFPANGGFTFGNGGGAVAKTTTAGNGLCLLQSGTAALAGNIEYVQQ